ncbi:restriction endonuclease subunit S [Legionella sainthelensi]|uniref:restriction endonuclease subunit S n=1 Tax=Legionella sainthelensi TaxID=28087 RepID=UPI000E1FBBFA|nr:restriction endonuclease subunit S [Legionella sainthelensi]
MTQTDSLSEIAEIIPGYAFKSTWFGCGNEKIIRISDIQNNQIHSENAISFDANIHPVSKRYQIQEGDILMALSGATTGKIGIAQKKDNGAYLNQRVAIIRGKNQINSRFLKYVFSGNRLNTLLLSAGGAAQANLSPKDLAMMQIPIPPLEDQNHIAMILDKADEVRRKRQQAIELSEQLLRSVFLDMFGDPVSNPKKYKIGKIGDLLSSINYGTSAKAGEEGKYPILRMNNITYEGDWNLKSLKYIDMTEKERQKYTAVLGDILFNRTNSKELVGKTAVFRETKPYIFAGYLIRSKTNSLAEPEYISGFLNSTYGKAVLRNMCKSIVGMANINAQEYQSIEILIPPIEEQQKYVKITKKIREQVSCYQRALSKLDQLFNSLSQQAFSGELSKQSETELV